MSSRVHIDPDRLFAAADALLAAIEKSDEVPTPKTHQGERRTNLVGLVSKGIWSPDEVIEAAAMLKRMGFLETDERGQ